MLYDDGRSVVSAAEDGTRCVDAKFSEMMGDACAGHSGRFGPGGETLPWRSKLQCCIIFQLDGSKWWRIFSLIWHIMGEARWKG